MFGWFKKKELQPPLLTEREERIALGAAAMIGSSLLMCTSSKNYSQNLHSSYARGYISGFIDAASVYAHLKFPSEEATFEFFVAGHEFMNSEVSSIKNFVLETFAHHSEEQDFIMGHQSGKSEYFLSMDENLNMPRSLIRFLMDGVKA